MVGKRTRIDIGARVHYCWHVRDFLVICSIPGRLSNCGIEPDTAEKKGDRHRNFTYHRRHAFLFILVAAVGENDRFCSHDGFLCGLSRPGHFDGVATVVAKLLGIVRPDLAIFGEKDYQQLLVVRQMVRDLDLDVDIVGAPIVREADGLAMSSRNMYLADGQRKAACSLYRVLTESKKRVKAGETRADTIIASAEALIQAHPETRIDYIAVCDPSTLDAVTAIDGPVLMALAVKVGRARLIDNMILTP